MMNVYTLFKSASDETALNAGWSHGTLGNTAPHIVRRCVEDMRVAYRPLDATREDMVRTLEEFRAYIGNAVYGPGFCLYEEPRGEKGIRLTCCYPVRQGMVPERIPVMALKGGVTVSLEHRGGLGSLGKSWELLFDFIEGENIPVVGARREIYRGLFERVPDSSLVELHVPVDMRKVSHFAAP